MECQGARDIINVINEERRGEDEIILTRGRAGAGLCKTALIKHSEARESLIGGQD